MYACKYVCKYACMCVCMTTRYIQPLSVLVVSCISLGIHTHIYTRVRAHTHTHTHTHLHAHTHAHTHTHTHTHTHNRYTHNPSALWWFVYLGYHFCVLCVLGYRWYKGTIWSKFGSNPWAEGDDPLEMEEAPVTGKVPTLCVFYVCVCAYIYIYIYIYIWGFEPVRAG